MMWHVDHLLCKVCQCKFEDGRVCEGIDGYAYCAEHWKKAFCPPCGHCKEAIEGPTINALDKSYHPDHFVCAICKERLTGQFFPSQDGEPLCENDYYQHLGLICGSCEQPIIAGKVVTMAIPNTSKEVKYHLEHFECNFCKSQLAGTPPYPHQHLLYLLERDSNPLFPRFRQEIQSTQAKALLPRLLSEVLRMNTAICTSPDLLNPAASHLGELEAEEAYKDTIFGGRHI